MTFTIGADPELFAEDSTGKLKSLIGLIGGTKEEPKWINEHKSLGVQEDNVAAEYCFAPCRNEKQFVQAVQLGRKYLESILQTNNFIISTKASGIFDTNELKHPKAHIFGCEPDYDAWELKINAKPKAPNPNFRTCGGHIHVGLDVEDIHDKIRLVKCMDTVLGLWSVIEDPDKERKQLYGKAGAFRPKSYGVEYRTLSNYWIFQPKTIKAIYKRTERAIELFKTGFNPERAIQLTINSGNVKNAQTLISTYGL